MYNKQRLRSTDDPLFYFVDIGMIWSTNEDSEKELRKWDTSYYKLNRQVGLNPCSLGFPIWTSKNLFT